MSYALHTLALTSYLSPRTSDTYTYDAVGNRLQTVDGGTTGYTPNPLNQYESVGGAPFTYDLNGNLTSDGVNTYTYDAENRLLSVVRGPSTVDFSYDAFGRRITVDRGPSTVDFTYDGDQILEERDESGAQLAEYVYGPGIDEVLRMERGGVPSYDLQDGLGSTIALTSSQGAVVESYRYDVYGKPLIVDGQGNPLSQSAFGNRYLFTGREYDQETGLQTNRGRYYDAKTGRFVSREPVQEDFNIYRYVLNSPTNWIDPWGLNLYSPQPPPINGTDLLGGWNPGVSIDIPISSPEGLSDWVPPLWNPPTGPDLLPGPAPGTEAGQKLQKSRCGSSSEGNQPGVLKAKGSSQGSKGGGQKGKKKDIQQIKDIGKQFGWDNETTKEFGDYIEEIKKGGPDFSFQELIQKALEFLGGR